MFEKLLVILDRLPSVTNVVVVGHLKRDRHPEIPLPPDRKGKTWQSWGEVVQAGQRTAKKDIKFWRGPAMSPIYGELERLFHMHHSKAEVSGLSNTVLYSSGTTGKPKVRYLLWRLMIATLASDQTDGSQAIVHTVGGMILSSKMGNLVHTPLDGNDCLLQVRKFTCCPTQPC